MDSREFSPKTWNGLEATCRMENSLFRMTILKQKWKLLSVVLPTVPSTLRSLLFLLFVKDLNNSNKVLELFFLRVITNIFCADDDVRTLFETANQKLDKIYDWFGSLNVEKNTDQDNIPLKVPSLQLNGNTERGNTLKFLRVILEEYLSRKKHIHIIENKVLKKWICNLRVSSYELKI